MTPDQELIDRLLYEAEGDSLDFKQAQYRFSRATDEEQGEFLKDILAFANSWRRTDAYIVIGAKDGRGERAELIGIEEDFDDARLQQFVNSKTNRPIVFQYKSVNLGEKKLGLIHIPTQSRPFFLKRDFGRLRARVVYLRRGSSTAEADPDEIAKMGSSIEVQTSRSPRLEVFIALGNHEDELVKEVAVDTEYLNLPSPGEIPDYEVPSTRLGNLVIPSIGGWANSDYYRELVRYLHQQCFTPVRLVVRNIGNALANDVRLVVDIEGNCQSLDVIRSDELLGNPAKDKQSSLIHAISARPVNRPPPDVSIKKLTSSCRVSLSLGKIQAKSETTTRQYFLLLPTNSCELKLRCSVFSDDLADPVMEELELDINVTHKPVTVAMLKRMVSAR